MLAETAVISLVTAKIRKGKFKNLSNFNIKGWYFFIIGLFIQSLPSLIEISKSESIIQFVNKYFFFMYLLSYILIFTTLILNFKEHSFKFIFLGTLLNFIVIFSNGGFMPVSKTSIIASGYTKAAQLATQIDYKHSLITAGTNFKILADIIPTPKQYPFHQIFSIGDLFIFFGAFLLIQNLMMDKKRVKELGEA